MMMAVRSVQQLVDRALEALLGGGSRREEASSRITRPGSRRKTRVKASSCASPADRLCPPVSSSVSSPCGSAAIPIAQFQFVERCQDLFVGDGAVEEGQVVAHAGAEQLHILGDDGHALAQRFSLASRRSTPSRRISPAGRVVQAEDQPRQGGLAAAGASQQPQHLPGLQREGQVVQHRVVRIVVGKATRPRKPEPSGRPADCVPGPSSHLRFDLAQLGQAFHTGADGLEALHLVGQRPDRFFQQVDVMDEQIDRADGDAPRVNSK